MINLKNQLSLSTILVLKFSKKKNNLKNIGFEIFLTSSRTDWLNARNLCESLGGNLIHKTLERHVGKFRVSYAQLAFIFMC